MNEKINSTNLIKIFNNILHKLNAIVTHIRTSICPNTISRYDYDARSWYIMSSRMHTCSPGRTTSGGCSSGPQQWPHERSVSAYSSRGIYLPLQSFVRSFHRMHPTYPENLFQVRMPVAPSHRVENYYEILRQLLPAEPGPIRMINFSCLSVDDLSLRRMPILQEKATMRKTSRPLAPPRPKGSVTVSASAGVVEPVRGVVLLLGLMDHLPGRNHVVCQYGIPLWLMTMTTQNLQWTLPCWGPAEWKCLPPRPHSSGDMMGDQ